MTIHEFFQTSSAIAAILMIQIGTSWVKQLTKAAVRVP